MAKTHTARTMPMCCCQSMGIELVAIFIAFDG